MVDGPYERRWRAKGWLPPKDPAVSGLQPAAGHAEGCGAHDDYDCDCAPKVASDTGAGLPDRLSDEERQRASDMLDLIAPLSVSSTWEPSERRTIIRALLAYGDSVAAMVNTARDAATPTDATDDIKRLRADIARLFEQDGNASCGECGAPLFDGDSMTTDEAERVALCAGHREPGQPIYAYRLRATDATDGATGGGEGTCAEIAPVDHEQFAKNAKNPTVESMREAIDAGLRDFCTDTGDFDMSPGMRRAAADFIMAQPGMFATTPGGDLLEQAARVADVEVIAAEQNCEVGYRPAHNNGAAEVAKRIATRIRALKPAGDGGEA
jgi:hypothetical protein